MTETLLTIPPETPRWQELASLHGITANLREESGEWTAWIEWFGAVEMAGGDTEREAVVALIHKLKLTHWETVGL